MEIWTESASGKLRSYLNQTEQANWTYNAIYFTLVRVNATFIRRTRSLATGRGIRGQGPPRFFVPLPNFVVSRNICLKHKMKTKILSPKNVFSPQTLKPDYVPVKNDWLGESCKHKLINLSHFQQPQAQTRSCIKIRSGRTINCTLCDVIHEKNTLH